MTNKTWWRLGRHEESTKGEDFLRLPTSGGLRICGKAEQKLIGGIWDVHEWRKGFNGRRTLRREKNERERAKTIEEKSKPSATRWMHA